MEAVGLQAGDDVVVQLSGAWRGLVELAIVLDRVHHALEGLAHGEAWQGGSAQARAASRDDGWLRAYA